MKKFNFMVTFFVATISYNLMHDVKKPTIQNTTQSQWVNYERENRESIAKAILFSLIASAITYIGLNGLSNHLRENA